MESRSERWKVGKENGDYVRVLPISSFNFLVVLPNWQIALCYNGLGHLGLHLF